MQRIIPLLPLLALAGCSLTPTESAAPVGSEEGWALGFSNPGQVLYGRDGAPVGSSAQSPVTVTSEPLNHTPEATEGSRPKILELYISEKNRADQIDEELAIVELEVQGFVKEVEALSARITELEASNASLMTERDTVHGQAFELAERLATAQLRRLEAEKALLEMTLEAKRKQAAEEGQ